MRINPRKIYWSNIFSLRSILYTIGGVFFAILGLQGFLLPNNFLDGGVTGISILVTGFSNIDFSLLLLLFNIPFVLVGYKKIGPVFGVRSFIANILLAAGLFFIHIPAFTEDKVLIAVFGGLFIGLGIGLVIRGGAVIDGVEVIAHYTEKKSAFSSGEIILSFNILIIIGAALQFGLEAGMYSILVYYTAMKTTDYVVDGFEEYTALNFISGEEENLKSLIVNDFKKAITIFNGERGYLPDSYEIHTDCKIIMTVVSRLEVHRIKEAVHKIDPAAFIFVTSIKEVKGGIFKRK